MQISTLWLSPDIRRPAHVQVSLGFNASHVSAKQLEVFYIEDMAFKMKELVPNLWLTLDILLMGEHSHRF
jgi:hypothetical protein